MKIIAETAFNHNGDINYLLNLIKKIKETKADYATVQIMNVEEFCEKKYERYNIYKNNSFEKQEWLKVFELCKKINLELIPCVLDISSFDICYNYGYRFFKLHATDIGNIKFLNYVKNKNCTFLLETQCATNQDIKNALSILKKSVVAIIHGFSDYPTDYEDLNLNALDDLKKKYKTMVGLADHTLDTNNIPLMCLSKNIEYLEKHITITRQNRNYDWQVSLCPEEFNIMIQTIRKYEKALGNGIKHPTKRELSYRDVLYKKFINGNFIRSDQGQDYITYKINNLTTDNVGIAIICRLNSQRLPNKILKKFHTNELIVDLYNKLNTINVPLYISTSTETCDDYLEKLCIQKNMKCFRGEADSVIDRMLSLSLKYNWGCIYRVTGDNPFTDPVLINEMYKLLINNDLDYVRVNNCPFGLSAELFKTSYLWKLYLEIENPDESEYLSWFVLNDNNCKKGCIEIESIKNLKYNNLSIDYEFDYNYSIELLNKINKISFETITIKDLYNNMEEVNIDLNKIIKLPNSKILTLNEYLSIIENNKYSIVKKYKI